MFTQQGIENLKVLMGSSDATEVKLAFTTLENKEIPLEIQQLLDEYREVCKWCYRKEINSLEEICFSVNTESKINLNDYYNTYETDSFIVPNGIRLFRQLKSFTGIVETPVAALPNSIGELGNLEILNLSGCRQLYPYLPEGLCNCNQLKYLYLQDNELAALPKNIGRLKNLEELDANGNNLEILPDDLYKCQKIKKLLLSYNRLAILPNFISELENLTELTISGNKFEHFPSVIGKCRGLTHLEISDNNFTIITNDIGNLENLKVLDLSENQITTLPETINKCKKLEVLWLNNNHFRTFPICIEKLLSLKQLHIENNFLSNEEKNIIREKCKDKNIQLFI